jgi:hypothetical protein
MRRAAKVDANQAEIVSGLRKIGATVTSTASVGNGFPDLCVGWRSMTFLLEIKDSNKPPSKRKLTADEADWHAAWRGHVAVVETLAQAIEAIGG